MSQGEYDKAVNILQKGRDRIGKKVSPEFIRLCREMETRQTNTQYQVYYDLCQNRQKKYGKGHFEYNGIDKFADVNLGGLTFVKLFDFNNDNNELILVYANKNATDRIDEYMYEIWAWQEEALVNILPTSVVNCRGDASYWVNTATKNGITYLQMCGYEEDNELADTG